MRSYKKRKYTYTFMVYIVVLLLSPAFVSCDKADDRTVSRQATKPSGPILDPVMRDTTSYVGKLPDNPEALARLGDDYFERQQFALAIDVYKKAIELAPDDVDTINDLGLSLHYAGRSTEAVDVLKKGTEVDPSFQRVWLSLGFVLSSLGRIDEARPVLERAAAVNPESPVGKEAKRMADQIR